VRELVFRAREKLGRLDAGRRMILDLLEAEAADLLRLAVFDDLEVLGLQTAHHGAGAIAHDDVDRDELRVGAEDRRLLCGRLLCRRNCRRCRGRQDRENERACGAHQKRNRRLSWAERAAWNRITWPKCCVSLTFTLTAAKFSVFRMFERFACSVNARLFFIRMSRENCALSRLVPGPVMLFRPALPNCPGGGVVNAAG